MDLLGPAICHQLDWRTMDGAWLCDRCTGLYTGGLLGVAAGWLAARRLRLRATLLLVGLLQLPVLVDKLVLGVGSPLDVTAWRITTGFLGGAGLGLLFTSRAATGGIWPAARHLESARPLLAVAAALLAAAAFFSAGVSTPLNAAVLLGLVALCAAATAWALELLGRLSARLRASPPGSPPVGPSRLAVIAGLVAVELLVVVLTPNEYKPTLGWLWAALSWLGW